MAEGHFRKELFFRLAGIELSGPPLRQRKEDIPLLVERMLARAVPPRTPSALPSNALRLLASYDWPGNVRELKNTVERMLLFPELGAESVLAPPATSFPHVTLREAKEAAAHGCERAYLIEKLRANGWNVSVTARALGMSRQVLTHMMGRHDLRVRELKK